MGYQVRTFDGDRDAWDKFLAQPSVFDHLSFLHSYEWGDFSAPNQKDAPRITRKYHLHTELYRLSKL